MNDRNGIQSKVRDIKKLQKTWNEVLQKARVATESGFKLFCPPGVSCNGRRDLCILTTGVGYTRPRADGNSQFPIPNSLFLIPIAYCLPPPSFAHPSLIKAGFSHYTPMTKPIYSLLKALTTYKSDLFQP